MRKISGDGWLLPQASLLNMVVLDEGEFVWVDGKDLQSCFNLFVLPEAWRGYCCFSKSLMSCFWGSGTRRVLRRDPGGADGVDQFS